MPIDVLPGAEEDIDRLEADDPDALAAVLTFLEEADGDDELIQKLTTIGDVILGSQTLTVRRWAQAQKHGNFLRIRILNTPATSYRVIYGYDWRKRRIGILAVVHKDQCDYDPDSELAHRIFDDWNTATDGQPT